MTVLEGFKELDHQAAGHLGVMTDPTGALFIKPTSQKEIEFYSKIVTAKSHDEGKDETESSLLDWIPVFMGTLQQGISSDAENTKQVAEELKQLDQKDKADGDDDKKYIVLQNLLYGFKKPSIIDIKLGSILYDENNTSESKMQRLKVVSETTTSGSLHYRVCGMKLYHNQLPALDKFKESSNNQITKDDQGYLKFDKWFGRELTKDNILDALKIFFYHNKLGQEQRDIVIKNTFTRLQLLYNCLLDEELTIRSGSLFLAYENDHKRWESMDNYDPIYKDDLPLDEEDEESEEDDSDKDISAPLSILSLIDFAHTSLTPGKLDDDILIGIENLLRALESLIT